MHTDILNSLLDKLEYFLADLLSNLVRMSLFLLWSKVDEELQTRLCYFLAVYGSFLYRLKANLCSNLLKPPVISFG